MGNVLMFNFPGEGHVNPTIALVEELIQQGEHVVYYCIEDYQNKIEKAGAEFRAYENFLPRMEKGKPRKGGEIAQPLIKGMDRVIEEVLPEVKAEEYDYVIYDTNFAAGKIIADQLQLPKISSCTTFALNQEIFSSFTVDREKMKMDIPDDEEIKDILGKWNEQYDFPVQGFTEIMYHPGDMTLVYTSKLYQPYADHFDHTYKFVGPSVNKRKDVEPLSFEDNSKSPLIYISMGTVFNEQPEFYQTCFEAFKESDATILMSVGKKTDISQLGDIPENFNVYNYVPQLDVLQQVDLFITHGGMNSSSEGLYFGVPMIVIPAGADQPLIAKRIEELEAGFALDPEHLDAEKLKSAAERVLANPAYEENSRKVGASLQHAGGYKKAVEEIFSFKQKNQIQ
ncbi:macrolide family glycosyltransferase [Falsibacillus albus]|uniref:Glycosyl transferase n=1 Tax=Falsibacillus albus TaxID=2478915 RepID=A0A3L7JK43_9BACI|nr:macrolide family glycosyltransferase [Falsibacillus albus]RLQ91168.1 glycosyl transferase [Falsibacillus albus]